MTSKKGAVLGLLVKSAISEMHKNGRMEYKVACMEVKISGSSVLMSFLICCSKITPFLFTVVEIESYLYCTFVLVSF